MQVNSLSWILYTKRVVLTNNKKIMLSYRAEVLSSDKMSDKEGIEHSNL